MFTLTTTENDSEWDDLVERSPQGNIFSDSRYLRALGATYQRYLVKNPHGEILAGVGIMEEGTAMHSSPFPFAPHQGIMFAHSVALQANRKRVTSEFRLTEFLINALVEQYGNFNMALSPAFSDLRPFLWHNYDKTRLSHFIIRHKYTALLDLQDFHFEKYLKSIRSVRRQEYMKSQAEIIESNDVPKLIDLYIATFDRQKIAINPKTLASIKNITIDAISKKYGWLSAAKTEQGLASMALFVYDKRTAYYLLCANNPELRASGASIKLMLENIKRIAEKGLKTLDFVGVNSPNRGDYKLSFNPRLTSYQEVFLKK